MKCKAPLGLTSLYAPKSQHMFNMQGFPLPLTASSLVGGVEPILAIYILPFVNITNTAAAEETCFALLQLLEGKRPG